MKGIYSAQIHTLLNDTDVAIANASTNETIKQRLLKRGYDDATMQSARDLRELVIAGYRKYQKAYALQIEATSKVKAKLYTETIRFNDLRQSFRIALRGDQYIGFRQQLGLDDTRQQTYQGIVDQTGKFFENALPNNDIKALVLKVGITDADLQAGADGLEDLKSLDKDQESKKGLAQTARKDRDDLVKTLRQWWTDFKSMCRREFRDNPQYLEVLGIYAPTEGYKSKKNTPETPQTPETPETPGGAEG